jgi:hypothetical protein
MQINWCLKGIAESSAFEDGTASAVLGANGILSNWMLANGSTPSEQANIDGQNTLSASALDDHVNNYRKVAATTPYISLCSGCVEFAGNTKPPIRYMAWRTALNFATKGGKQSGYVFRCWVMTSLKPAPELPGLAEEVRDLNLFANFFAYHRQGEVTAKLVVPRRQVQWVMKFDRNLQPESATWAGATSVLLNPDFMSPDRISNIVPEIV